jgi:2-polyprenyl-3-methyl-5-hydroxy-6-metoxy-1,4-benzoquinol methylase
MKRSYWEKIAPDYDDEIFDVLHNDKKALIRSAIEKTASSKKTVIDIGCAIGKWLPVLSPAFGRVIALDISSKNLAIAAKRYPEFTNVEYLREDMSKKNARIPKADTAICINAILTPSQKDRDIFFRNLETAVRKGGRVILSVPSLESGMLSTVLATRFKLDKKLLHENLTPAKAREKWKNIQEGNKDIDGVPHKHFLREELQLILTMANFTVTDIQKIEYDWKTEFTKPPKWLKGIKPWDWMVVATKN